MLAKGKAMTIAANGRSHLVIRGALLAAQRADAAIIIEIARSAGIAVHEKRLSLTDAYTADECFVTGTMGELVCVREIDGRRIGTGEIGPVTTSLQTLYAERTKGEGESLPF